MSIVPNNHKLEMLRYNAFNKHLSRRYVESQGGVSYKDAEDEGIGFRIESASAYNLHLGFSKVEVAAS
ncbi:hypothetical protein EV292_106198 [Sphingomonas sp. BK235]|nr:hypothetical protein EV292_106198 [Sphingomonas sp. BK235]